MANITFTESQTVLINSGRQQVATPAGDLWRALQGRVTNSERFAMGGEYNTLEDQIDATIDGGSKVFGTNGDGSHPEIGKAPLRPHPPTS